MSISDLQTLGSSHRAVADLTAPLRRLPADAAGIGSSPPLLHAGAVLLGVGFKSLLLLLIFAAACACLRRASAALRHAAWLIAIACLLLLPAVSLWQACLPQRVLQPLTLRAPLPVAMPAARRPGRVVIKVTVLARSGKTPAQAQETYLPNTAQQPASYLNPEWIISARRIVAWLPVIWLAGAVVLLARLAICLVLARQVIARCLPIFEGPIWQMAEDARRQVGHVGLLGVCLGEWGGAPSVPMTLGIARPVVLLPAAVIDWPRDRATSALLHEIAHVRRRDWAAQVAASAACALYWFNPLVWLAASRLRAESEMACDDLALLAGAPAADYAGHLLEIARMLSGARRRVPTAVAAASRPQIEGRVRAILDRARPRVPLSPRARALALALAILLLVPLALMRWETKASAQLRSQGARLATRLALPPALAAGSERIRIAMKGNSPMDISKLFALKPTLARTAATLAGLSLIASPTVSSAQSAPAAALPAASSSSQSPTAVPAGAAIPVPASPSPSTTPPVAPAGTVTSPTAPFRIVGSEIAGIGGQSQSIPQQPASEPGAPVAVSPIGESPYTAINVGTGPAGLGNMNAMSGRLDYVPMTTGSMSREVSMEVGTGGEHLYAIKASLDSIPSLIAQLCQAAGVSYTIGPETQEFCEVDMKPMPFDAALRNLLEVSAPPMSYRVEDGVYHFFEKADPADDSALPQIKVSLDLDNAPFDEALKQLFDSAHASYTLQGNDGITATFGKTDVVGTRSPVTLHLHDVSFAAALRAILSTANPALTYKVKDGIVYIGSAPATMELGQFSDQATPSYQVVQPYQAGQPWAEEPQVAQPYVYKPGDWKGLNLKDGGSSPNSAQPAQPAQPQQ